MANDIKVSPTPIQRNALDVAMELTQIYLTHSSQVDIEKLDSIFARFYAVANTVQVKNYRQLERLIPEDLMLKIGTSEH